MSFPRYESYKYSGVEWLAEVPAHWLLCSLRYCLNKVFNGLTSMQIDEADGTVPVTRIETISKGNIDEKRLGFINALDARDDKRLLNGDILFSNINSLNMIGNCAIYEGGREIYAGMNLLVLRPEELIKPKWLYWLIKSSIFRQHVESLAKPAINQASISQTSINSIGVSVPPKEEQQSIAAFLDRETAKIDALITAQQRLIELLKEKRQAVISHAVTKGLNPDAPMKDSGIEWLGEVPAHWAIKQLKHVVNQNTSITYGIVQAGPNHEGGIPYIKTSDMSGDCLPLSGYSLTSPEIDKAYERSKVVKGDLVIAIRATVGKCLPVPDELEGANLTQGTAKISPGPSVDKGFLLAAINASSTQAYFNSMAKGATFKEITLDALRRTTITLPPIEEQIVIANFLDQETAKLDNLTTEAQRAIDLLKERRSALISAAVTGKIDVRSITAEQSTEEVPA